MPCVPARIWTQTGEADVAESPKDTGTATGGTEAPKNESPKDTSPPPEPPKELWTAVLLKEARGLPTEFEATKPPEQSTPEDK
jgi:hypothetical protein